MDFSHKGVKTGDAGSTSGKSALAAGINHRFNSAKTEFTNNKTKTTEIWNFDADFTAANSIEDVGKSDHLLVVVDKVNGKVDPALTDADARGIAAPKGEISYLAISSDFNWLVESGVHEIGHNLGFQTHEKYGTQNYMSYDHVRKSFYPTQIMGVFNMASHGYLNQGSNSERVQVAAPWSNHTSTNDEPYKYSTSPGERIPKIFHNDNEK